ncbi:MAG: hypothetical protein M3314_04500, partial [Actinomycetota bacterium]|nr:hypothetical protein [Actinomycetota bacterium]
PQPSPAVPDVPVEAPSLPLRGCPPPPRPSPGGGAPAPVYVPPKLVPEEELPEPQAPAPWTADLRPLEGKGMWLWKYRQSEGGNPDAIVAKAAAAGLRQLWVRVGDSKDGFYAREVLDALVPRAHRQGIAVIGWGFPFLFDPVADARWTAEALAWRSPEGHVLDGFSPDIELPADGVAISEKRVRVYLDLVRRAAPSRLVVATVYRPSDRLWPSTYPYAAMAPYVDAFAPMVYWACLEPGATAAQAIERLRTLRPVHAIGQAWDMRVDSGNRGAAPDELEIRRFLDVSRRQGALGGSLWVWHLTGEEQWSALSAFRWLSPQ